ncbi:hypothetical protein GY45DRAFT_1374350 [Cubamyces sp. BRFM 1775]|nr:hypothetical protein GY45DRAFT_1374350 [Cubamyces sp. BRFM 1775]
MTDITLPPDNAYGGMKLNFDVLLQIIEICNPPEGYALIQTCRVLYAEGPKYLLTQTIRIENWIGLQRFLSFLEPKVLVSTQSGLSSDSLQQQQRHYLVRSLNFNINPSLTFVVREDLPAHFQISAESAAEQQVALRALVTALPRMTALSSLTIWHSEAFFRSRGPDLVAPFAALTSLRTLEVYYGGPKTVRMLRELQSSLIHACIDFNGSGNTPYFDVLSLGDWPAHHPVVMLGRSAETLETLRCRRWRTHPTIAPDPDTTPVYPRMRELSVDHSTLPVTIAYIRAYPNLTSFRFSSGLPPHELHVYPDYPQPIECKEQHEANVAAQLREGLAWERLEWVSASSVDLYMLGLTRRVPHVTVQQLASFAVLAPALEHLRPSRLDVEWGPLGFEEAAIEDVHAALSGPGASQLKSLDIRLELYKAQRNLDIGALLFALVSSLCHTALEEFRIRIWAAYLDISRGVPRKGKALCAAERALNTFDAEAYLHRCTSTLSSLREAELSIEALRGKRRKTQLAEGQIQSGPWSE